MWEFEKVPGSQWNEMRSFCAHELAAQLDSLGGLCSLSYIDAVELDGVLYPDERTLPILNRDNAQSVGRPIYGPAVQLFTRTQKGRDILHYPVTHTFAPNSLRGGDGEQTYLFFMERDRIFWRVGCGATDAEEVCWCLQPATLFCGKKNVHLQQHTGTSSTQSGGLYTKEELENNKPVLNGAVDVAWQIMCFDEAQQTLYIQGTVNYGFGRKSLYLAIGSDAPVTCRESADMTMLCALWADRQETTFTLALGSTREEAYKTMRDGTANCGEILARNALAAQAIEANASAVRSDKLEAAEAFGQMAAQYLNAMTVGKTAQGDIGVRAAAYKYGYFSLWDAIYPVRDLLWNGRLADAQRQITYLLTLPMMENTPIAGLHGIVQLNEVLAFCPAWNIDHLYPAMVKIFRMAVRATEPVYRMLVLRANVGVDKPQELGLADRFLSPEVNALWYMACRVVKNEALHREDSQISREADHIISALEKGYAAVFFDESAGYLRSAVKPDLTLPEKPIFQNTNTWGYDYPFGMYLMRDLVKPLAEYQANCLYHPEGHRAVAVDSPILCEMWKHVHMNQHNGHEMKLQRMAGKMEEVYRVMGKYLARFSRWQVAEETTNFSRFAIHPSQVCDWQAFSATANMEALRSAVAGILRHRGGISYLPAEDCGETQISNVPMGEGRISVAVAGAGKYGVLVADGREIPGTLQVPADVTCNALKVRRTDALPEHPVLMMALDMPVKQVAVQNNCLHFVCGRTASAPVCFLSDTTLSVSVNGSRLSVQYDPGSKQAWVDHCWREGDAVTAQR